MTTAHAARARFALVAGVLACGLALGLLSNGEPAPVRAAQKEEPKAQPPAKVDPLHPKDPGDAATSFLACAKCHNEKPPIDVKGNPYAQRFKSHEFVLFSEGRTWTAEDPHSAAFRVLEGPLGKQMSEILKYDVTKAAQCLTCHSIDLTPGQPLPKEPAAVAARFDTSDGVTCNACHGLRKPWQAEHFEDKPAPGGGRTIPWRTFTPERKEEAGMRNLRDPVVKAQLCASCHVGSPELGRVVTHDMYAAGHPPLPPFELGSFMESQPKHWGYPVDPMLKFFTEEGVKAYAGADFVTKNPNWTWDLYRFHPADKEVFMARRVVAGSVAALHAELKLLAADAELVMKGEEGAVDFARFDCFACHHDLKYPSDRQKRGYDGFAPGRPPLKAWTVALPSVAVAHAAGLPKFADASKSFDEKWKSVRSAALARPFGKPKELAAAANDMVKWCEDFMRLQQTEGAPVYTKAEAEKLLKQVREAAVSKQWTADPEAAMVLTWAYLTLRSQMGMPVDAAQLDNLGKVIPTRVRMQPYSTDDGPRTVGDTLRQRLDLFRRYDANDFTTAFKGLNGGK